MSETNQPEWCRPRGDISKYLPGNPTLRPPYRNCIIRLPVPIQQDRGGFVIIGHTKQQTTCLHEMTKHGSECLALLQKLSTDAVIWCGSVTSPVTSTLHLISTQSMKSKHSHNGTKWTNRTDNVV